GEPEIGARGELHAARGEPLDLRAVAADPRGADHHLARLERAEPIRAVLEPRTGAERVAALVRYGFVGVDEHLAGEGLLAQRAVRGEALAAGAPDAHAPSRQVREAHGLRPRSAAGCSGRGRVPATRP